MINNIDIQSLASDVTAAFHLMNLEGWLIFPWKEYESQNIEQQFR